MKKSHRPQNQFRLSGNGFERPFSGSTEVKRIVFISAEGTETEPSYFKLVNNYLQKNGRCPFLIHVLKHNRDEASSPDRVLELLEECRRIREDLLFKDIIDESSRGFSKKQIKSFFTEPARLSAKTRKRIGIAITKLGINFDYYRYLHELGSPYSKDSFAIVLDRDPQGRSRSELEKILSVCRERKIGFCLSNPCFEFWLILHFDYRLTKEDRKELASNKHISKDNTYASRLLSSLAHHQKKINSTAFNQLYLHKTKKALLAAKRFATDETAVLDELGTRVPIIIEPIINWL